ncbi:hypothetical protein [Shewanella algae]|uniref:hypothetical protein n=1 Tax=Shewanella algae TaxID=38313 RepID=UPI003C5E14A9
MWRVGLSFVNLQEDQAITELLRQVAKTALLTIVPIIVHALTEHYLSEENDWNEPLENEDDDIHK